MARDMGEIKESRERYWEELETNEEKIERLRRELKRIKRLVVEQAIQVDSMDKHVHLQDGGIAFRQGSAPRRAIGGYEDKSL